MPDRHFFGTRLDWQLDSDGPIRSLPSEYLPWNRIAFVSAGENCLIDPFWPKQDFKISFCGFFLFYPVLGLFGPLLA
jgi:hypothetical protein